MKMHDVSHDCGEDVGSVGRPTALGTCRRKILAQGAGSDHIHGGEGSPTVRADGVHIMGERCVPCQKRGARQQARVSRMQKPYAVAGGAAGHDVHVAVGVLPNPVAIAKEGFQEGADATTELDHVDMARLGH